MNTSTGALVQRNRYRGLSAAGMPHRWYGGGPDLEAASMPRRFFAVPCLSTLSAFDHTALAAIVIYADALIQSGLARVSSLEA